MKLTRGYFLVSAFIVIILNFFVEVTDQIFLYILATFILVWGLYYPEEKRTTKERKR